MFSLTEVLPVDAYLKSAIKLLFWEERRGDLIKKSENRGQYVIRKYRLWATTRPAKAIGLRIYLKITQKSVDILCYKAPVRTAVFMI